MNIIKHVTCYTIASDIFRHACNLCECNPSENNHYKLNVEWHLYNLKIDCKKMLAHIEEMEKSDPYFEENPEQTEMDI